MIEETKAKIREAHKIRAKDPAVVARLRQIARDPVMKASRSAKMKAKWANPEWRANQLAKRSTPVVEAPAKKKRIITEAQRLKYAANRKTKRAAAKQ